MIDRVRKRKQLTTNRLLSLRILSESIGSHNKLFAVVQLSRTTSSLEEQFNDILQRQRWKT